MQPRAAQSDCRGVICILLEGRRKSYANQRHCGGNSAWKSTRTPSQKPEPINSRDHLEERATGEPVREPKPVPRVLFSCPPEKDQSPDCSSLGAAFEGLSVTTPQGKETGKGGEGGHHEAAHDHERVIAFIATPSSSATGLEGTGPTADSGMDTPGLPTHPTTSSPRSHSPMAEGTDPIGPSVTIHTSDITMEAPPTAHLASEPFASRSGYT